VITGCGHEFPIFYEIWKEAENNIIHILIYGWHAELIIVAGYLGPPSPSTSSYC
jgi:hypothetical protein